MLLKLLNYLTDTKYSFFIKIAKFQLNNFNRSVININSEKNLGLWGGGVGFAIVI